MLVSEEVLCKFDMLSTKIESVTPLKLEDIILGLGAYFSPVNVLSQKNCVMRHGTKKPHKLKVGR